MSDGGYTFHMGMKFVKFMDYIDETATKLGTSRSKLITAVLYRVLDDGLLEVFGSKAEPVVSFRKFYGRVKTSKGEYMEPAKAPELPKHSPIAKRRRAEQIELHPLQSLKTTSEPLPAPRTPSYATSRPHVFHGRQVEKTKNQLREELRLAIENTKECEGSHE